MALQACIAAVTPDYWSAASIVTLHPTQGSKQKGATDGNQACVHQDNLSCENPFLEKIHLKPFSNLHPIGNCLARLKQKTFINGGHF